MYSADLARPQDKGFGIGIIVGEPTGIKGKVWLSERTAFDFGFGWSLGGYSTDKYDKNMATDESRFHVHADYLWHDFRLIRADRQLPVFYGFGGRMNSGAGLDNSLGIRGIFGIAWVPESVPFDVFLEVTPVLQLNPSTRVGLNGGVGARFFIH